MIAEVKVREIERLLADGTFSQRKIAKMTGISRAVVGTIAAGSRPDYEARRLERQQNLPEPLGPVGRCPGCGGLVYTPCIVCRVRRIKEHELRQVRVARRLAREQSLRELLHRLREASLRRDPPTPKSERRAG
jgi:hypothetical protein